MKKMFLAGAVVAAVLSVYSADAQCKVCGQEVKLKADKFLIHEVYENGDIDMEAVKEGLEETGNNWNVKERNKNVQVWQAGDWVGRDVTFILKEQKNKKVVKAHLGNDRMFAKDLRSKNGKKHTGKILNCCGRHVKKHIVNEDGIDIVLYEKPAKEKKEKKEKKSKK